MSDSTPRPSQTTMAAGMVMAGSVLVVVTSGEQLASLNSLETRRAVSDFLASAPGTGLDVPSALVALRTALMVVAGCATAAGILGFHVLRRSRSARLGLTVLAAPILVVGLATGGFFSSLVAVASLLLWIEPSRAWLERRPLPEPPSRPGAATRSAGSPWAPPGLTPPRTDQPPPHVGAFGAPVPPPEPTAPPRPPETRPVALVWACAVTWGLSGLTVVLLAASLTLLATDPSLVWAELDRQNPDLLSGTGLTRDDVLRTTYAVLGIAIAWSLLAIVLSVLTFLRRPGGRIGLVVCAAAAGVVCLVGSFAAALLLAPALGCLATVVLLMRADVRGWFDARRLHP